LFLSDESLVVQGRAFVGFPLLVHRDGTAVEPAQSFLWDVLTTNGRAQSPLTWAKYGRDIYDYFAFLDANELDWQTVPSRGMPSVVDWYRDWSKGEIGLDSVTINARLRLIARFYRWAQQMGFIKQLPFRYQVVRVARTRSLCAGTRQRTWSSAQCDASRSRRQLNLTMEQVLVCPVLSNITQRMMFELMVRCGLRQIECGPSRSYLFDLARRRDLVQGQMIRLPLSNKDMKLKYDKPRAIDVPYDLMEDLGGMPRDTANHVSGRLRATSTSLFLTQNGTPYETQPPTSVAPRSAWFQGAPYASAHLWNVHAVKLRKVGFDGAIALRAGSMGHSSVSTTSIYLHLINQLGRNSFCCGKTKSMRCSGSRDSMGRQRKNFKAADPVAIPGVQRRSQHQRKSRLKNPTSTTRSTWASGWAVLTNGWSAARCSAPSFKPKP
jgi:site-specific recombinase XerD